MRTRSVFGLFTVVLVCGTLSSWGLVTQGLPVLARDASRLARMYDSKCPEIIIRGGKLAVPEKHPYVLPTPAENWAVLVIDTRETGFQSLLENLAGAGAGAVLTKDAAIVKVGEQIRILPLPQIPDMVLNSRVLEEFVREKLPHATKALAGLIVVCCVAVKLAQALLLGLVAYAAGRVFSVAMNCAEALQAASMAVIATSLLDLIVDIRGIHVSSAVLVHCALWTASLALCLGYRAKHYQSIAE